VGIEKVGQTLKLEIDPKLNINQVLRESLWNFHTGQKLDDKPARAEVEKRSV
jgi:hypothetical protein